MPRQANRRGSRRGVATILLLSLAGCSSLSGPSVPTPNDPQQAAQAAMETYDTNDDGKIADGEFDNCHALKSVIALLDTNRDGAITLDELVQRLESYQSQSTFVDVVIHVSKGGVPVADAIVTMTPEPFLGSGFQVFEGKSDSSGAVLVEGRDSVTPGVPIGLYRVTISHPSSHTKKTTGCEVSDDTGNRLSFSM